MAKQSDPLAEPSRARGGVPVILTRPEASAKAFATALATRFPGRTRPVIAPLMQPEFLAVDLPTAKPQGMIFTSATGVEAALRLGLASGPAYCVGKATAARANAAGFKAQSADGDADALVAHLLDLRPTDPLWHLCGAETRGDVAARLTASGLRTEEIVVYRQMPHPLTPEALALLRDDGPLIVPLFSPRSARLFIDALPQGRRAMLWLAVISPAVSEAVSGIGPAGLVTAPSPDAAGMLEAVGDLLDQIAPP